ncbi:MAG: release factor glutamine methyltransferase HemK [Oceanicaulis sp. HLUCCA04]|nr:MAG: release factor glutamine methyltransferase HemK [Oceanicaulis sp. HLUCCA04]
MTLHTLVKAAAARLADAGIDDAQDDARRLLRHALGLDAAGMVARGQAPLSDEEAARFEALIARRALREPLSHIIGMQPFWTFELEVSRDVLTPRSDTETLVRAALGALANHDAGVRILDIATGSGAIALALLSELPDASAVATDISPPALEIARSNADRLGLAGRIAFHETSWADGLEGPFDLIVSNPPYIDSAVIPTLEPEVSEFEPLLALNGGEGGLAPYPHLLEEARRLLTPGGHVFFEIGHDQGAAVCELARMRGFDGPRIIADLAGHGRVLALHD